HAAPSATLCTVDLPAPVQRMRPAPGLLGTIEPALMKLLAETRLSVVSETIQDHPFRRARDSSPQGRETPSLGVEGGARGCRLRPDHGKKRHLLRLHSRLCGVACFLDSQEFQASRWLDRRRYLFLLEWISDH